jgi:hypothetical protein
MRVPYREAPPFRAESFTLADHVHDRFLSGPYAGIKKPAKKSFRVFAGISLNLNGLLAT